MAIETILAQLAVVEKTISGIHDAYDKSPGMLAALPVVVNKIDSGEFGHGGDGVTPFGQRETLHRVKAMVVVARADLQQAEANARPFIKLFADAIDGHYTLNSTCLLARVVDYAVNPEFEAGGLKHLAVEITVEIREREYVTLTA